MSTAYAMENTLESVIHAIKEHDAEHPDHGVGCSCHDAHAGALRRLFESEGLYEIRGGYRSQTKSLSNLLVVIGYVQRNP